MRMLLRVFVLIFSINPYIHAQETVNEDKKFSDIDEISFIPLSGKVFDRSTFVAYQSQKKVSSDIAVWRDRYQLPQKQYKVSLVGMNINTWLENPEYFNVLIEQGEKFSVRSLLDNLQSYNPNLIFNDPQVVAQALKKDIYTPYLKIISNEVKSNFGFSDVDKIISYTRRFHIFGVAGGGLPYFGRPMEGGRREINLGILSGQIPEIAVKLPETDIFLVAMINVIPNWLEEGLNIFQVNQQELEIIVYAFDRNGKMLGGAGVPMNFVHAGKHYFMEQKIRSQIWQAGTSRSFYIWPSYNIKNDRDITQPKQSPNIIVPPATTPSLNQRQKYILAAINYLRTKHKNTDVELFDQNGKEIVKPEKIKNTNKVILANRILLHKNSDLLVCSDVKSDYLSRINVMARLNNVDKKEKYQNAFSFKYYPSNEGRKLESILNYGDEIIDLPPFTHNGKLFFTNFVRSYELETDPVIYASKRKKYVVLGPNLNELKKEFNKRTKDIIAQKKMEYKEKCFWEEFKISQIKVQHLLTDEIVSVFQDWKRTMHSLKKAEAKYIKSIRYQQLLETQENQFDELKKRNIDLLTEKYVKNQNKMKTSLEQLDQKGDRVLAHIIEKKNNSTMLDNISLLKQERDELMKKEQEYSIKLSNLYPNNINYLSALTDHDTNMMTYNRYAFDIGVDKNLILLSINSKKYSPLFKFQRKQDRLEANKNQYIPYEGFMLGLTRSWKVRTTLADRLDYL